MGSSNLGGFLTQSAATSPIAIAWTRMDSHGPGAAAPTVDSEQSALEFGNLTAQGPESWDQGSWAWARRIMGSRVYGGGPFVRGNQDFFRDFFFSRAKSHFSAIFEGFRLREVSQTLRHLIFINSAPLNASKPFSRTPCNPKIPNL